MAAGNNADVPSVQFEFDSNCVNVKANMDVQITKSTRGVDLIIVDSYKFRKVKTLTQTGEVFWRCTVKLCRATVHTIEKSITRTNLTHFHLPDVGKNNRHIVNVACKRKATEDLVERPARIISSELKGDLATAITTRDVQYIRKNIYNARRKCQSALPKNMYVILLIII